jgi:hypothetical protein
MSSALKVSLYQLFIVPFLCNTCRMTAELLGFQKVNRCPRIPISEPAKQALSDMAGELAGSGFEDENAGLRSYRELAAISWRSRMAGSM